MPVKRKKCSAISTGVLFVLHLFASVTIYAQEPSSNWFPFIPSQNTSSSSINMQHWLDAPAGKHGFVQMNKDDLQFENAKKLKFWGVNIAGDRPFMPVSEAEDWVQFIAAYGINAVRFHKFTWEATDGVHSTKITDDKWNNFDHFSSRLKANGIYYGWSHIYGHRVLQGDSNRVLNYKEIVETKFPWSHLNGTTASLVNFAEDLQALNIELTVNMLNHRNPNTGLRYADDPALAFVEMQNEDNIFWGAIEETLKQAPAYRALLCEKFSSWLEKKYKTNDALVQAWGRNNLPANESIAQKNIYPKPNHGFFSSESANAWKAQSALPQHVVDKAIFLYEEQNRFYTKFREAIRRTGYKGLIIGSCWQAGSGLAHLLNLHADYNAGVIDRHNYFGGGSGHVLQMGKFRNEAMVSKPGSGLLSTGFQQVADRPFFISEWMSLIPNEWTAESSPIIAAYGMGLQGWDGSFGFAMDRNHFTPTIQNGRGIYNVTSPTQLALYPALAAMVYRNDLLEGKVVAERSVSLDELKKGELPFFEKVEQQADIKSIESNTPLAALAKGMTVVSFKKQKNAKPDLDLFTADSTIVSTTGQLLWRYGGKGFFTINSKGTQGVVGFAKDSLLKLNDISIKTENEFAVILISSLEKNGALADAKKMIITTIARARNTGMQFNNEKNELLTLGKAPIVMEPVVVEIVFNKKKNARLHVLDHSGNRTGEAIPLKDGKVLLDGNRHKTVYYELEIK